MPVVVLVADTDSIGKAILRFLSDLLEIKVIGEAATLPEAVSKTTKLHPDAVVLI